MTRAQPIEIQPSESSGVPSPGTWAESAAKWGKLADKLEARGYLDLAADALERAAAGRLHVDR